MGQCHPDGVKDQLEFGVKGMESYWYVTKSKLKPNRRGLVSILQRKNYTIVELAVQADRNMIERYDLQPIGYGLINSVDVQRNLLKEIKKIR